MIAITSSLPALPLGIAATLDAASIIVIALVVGAVGVVFWASRPSVVARYSTKTPLSTPGAGEKDDPGSGDLRA